MNCFSLPADAPGLREWSKFLNIPLEIRKGMIGGKQICKILDRMIKNNQKLEISDYNIKKVVVSYYTELTRMEKGGIISLKFSTKMSNFEGIYEMEFEEKKELEELLENSGEIYLKVIEVDVSKLCEYLHSNAEMKKIEGNEKFKEYLDKVKMDLNAQKLQFLLEGWRSLEKKILNIF